MYLWPWIGFGLLDEVQNEPLLYSEISYQQRGITNKKIYQYYLPCVFHVFNNVFSSIGQNGHILEFHTSTENNHSYYIKINMVFFLIFIITLCVFKYQFIITLCVFKYQFIITLCVFKYQFIITLCVFKYQFIITLCVFKYQFICT